MQMRRKADFPGPPPRACAAETFPMTIGYPNFRHVWEKTGVAIELGNALTGRIASEYPAAASDQVRPSAGEPWRHFET